MSREVTHYFTPTPSKLSVFLPIPLFKRDNARKHVALQTIKKVTGFGRTWIPPHICNAKHIDISGEQY
eukprot:2192699-Karenia_brevis.AAC.1